ncbi:FAD-dependent oxidoreductase [Kistimonas asteriae]|uniref:FAD-dependent oxidoreductase n=1 Tax=Kistimonas asteriae TaxID=517724 RepID=UPI001BA7831B|nr:hypothetical protein [Kistimonas asteriae]
MQRAVVIGGSVAGLVAAKAIAPFFEEVILLEKDTLNDENGLHKGVGQGAHAHVLLPSGVELLKQLLDLPSIDLEAFGLVPADTASELKWFQFGVWKTRFHSGIDMGWCYRSRFEWQVRQSVLAVDNIRIESPARVTGLFMSASGHHVAGVCYKVPGSENADITHKLAAELVIDASGRGTHTPRWLENAGIARVVQDEISVQVAYTTRRFRFPPAVSDALDWKVLSIYAEPPNDRRGGLIYPIGSNEWMATLVGGGGEVAPMALDGYLDFAQSLPQPDIYRVLKQAIPVGEPCSYRCPGSLWRRYDRMEQWPGHFVVIGDAVCSFNPIYGQGITAALKDVQALRSVLEKSTADLSASSMMQLQKMIARGKAVPWHMAACPDFIYPETRGKRPLCLGMTNGYLKALMKLAGRDRVVHQRFIEVFTYLKSPLVLLAPGIMVKVLGQKLWG